MRTRYIITLEPRPPDPRRSSEADAAIRLKHLLKIAGRGLGFRCIEIREQQTIQQEHAIADNFTDETPHHPDHHSPRSSSRSHP